MKARERKKHKKTKEKGNKRKVLRFLLYFFLC